MYFLKKLRNSLLGLNPVIFSEKLGTGPLGLKHGVFFFFFMKVVVNGNMFQ